MLHNKFKVTRTDGKDVSGADFFVLRLDAHGDDTETLAALEAAIYYASLINDAEMLASLEEKRLALTHHI